MRFVDARTTLPRHPSKRWRTRPVNRILGMVVHHTAGGDDPTATARYHVGPNHTAPDGMPGLAYTFFVRQNGEIVWANDLESSTWSQGGKNGHPDVDGDGDVDGDDGKGAANDRFLGIVCGGNFDSQYNPTGQQPTAQQIHALLCLTLHLTGAVEDHRIPGELFGALPCGPHDVYAHADFGKPACPGATLTALLGALRTHRAVGRGMRREEATDRDVEWQRALVGRGYDLGNFGPERDGVDGEWGPSSRKALIQFQKDVGLPTSGHRDGPTEAALFGGN